MFSPQFYAACQAHMADCKKAVCDTSEEREGLVLPEIEIEANDIAGAMVECRRRWGKGPFRSAGTAAFQSGRLWKNPIFLLPCSSRRAQDPGWHPRRGRLKDGNAW